MQGYLTLHLYGIVCPSDSKAFADFKGCLSWYSSAMLTPSEKSDPISLPFLSVFFDLTYHNITDAKLVPRKLKSSMIYSWMTSLTSAFRIAEVPDSLFYLIFLVPVVLYICTEVR